MLKNWKIGKGVGEMKVGKREEGRESRAGTLGDKDGLFSQIKTRKAQGGEGATCSLLSLCCAHLPGPLMGAHALSARPQAPHGSTQEQHAE